MPDVVLRLVDDADYDRLFSLLSHPTSCPPPKLASGLPRRDDFDAALTRYRSDKSVVLRAIVVDDYVAGCIIATDTGQVPQIEFVVHPDRRNLGIATGAVLAFTAMMKRRPLHARVSPTNGGAIRVLEKAGFASAGPVQTGDSTVSPEGGDLSYELGFFPAATFMGTPIS